jgi:ketosteroid isomerase-like protein
MEERQLKDIAVAYYTALNDKDIESLSNLFKQDACFDYPSAHLVQDLPAISDFFSQSTKKVPDLHVVIKAIFACKNRVAVHWFSRGIKDITDTIDEHHGVDMFHIEDGLIQKLTVTYSLDEMNSTNSMKASHHQKLRAPCAKTLQISR